MRVFVFGTGRCGTVSVRDAFAVATNYESGHETFVAHAYYPENWIEVNPQLRITLPRVLTRHPDALYIWLTRDKERVLESYERLDLGAWLSAFYSLCPSVRPNNRWVAARFAVDQMLRDCQASYRTVPANQRLQVDIDNAAEWFPEVWQRIGAEGDLAAAVRVFDTPRNTSKERGDA